jgi:nicotinate-nucleotide pyrophosphorylase (carboxylating)
MDITPAIAALIDLALEEDLGRGDVTSLAIFEPAARARGHVVAKQDLVLSGVAVARAVFLRVDAGVQWKARAIDGTALPRGGVIAEVSGPARSLLGAERTALNFLQRLSGIATHTRRFVDAVAGTRAAVVDTRKTAPGWRALDKAAVAAGGGRNHRADLASGVLIKDNHIAACGSIAAAVRRARAGAPHLLKVQVEVSTLEQLDEALDAGAEAVLLDNVTAATAAVLCARVGGRVPVELSGNVRLETIRGYAEAGVDLISVGALTHSAPAADLSLEMEVLGS